MTMQSLQAEIEAAQFSQFADDEYEFRHSPKLWLVKHTLRNAYHDALEIGNAMVVSALYFGASIAACALVSKLAPCVQPYHEAIGLVHYGTAVFFGSLMVCWFGYVAWLTGEFRRLWNRLPVSTRRIGGLRYVKLYRLCVSVCITKTYKPL